MLHHLFAPAERVGEAAQSCLSSACQLKLSQSSCVTSDFVVEKWWACSQQTVLTVCLSVTSQPVCLKSRDLQTHTLTASDTNVSMQIVPPLIHYGSWLFNYFNGSLRWNWHECDWWYPVNVCNVSCLCSWEKAIQWGCGRVLRGTKEVRGAQETKAEERINPWRTCDMPIIYFTWNGKSLHWTDLGGIFS